MDAPSEAPVERCRFLCYFYTKALVCGFVNAQVAAGIVHDHIHDPHVPGQGKDSLVLLTGL